LTRQKGFSPLLLGLGWIAVELALQPLGLRYGLLAATQGSGLVVRTMGYLAGYVMVAFHRRVRQRDVVDHVARRLRGGAGVAPGGRLVRHREAAVSD
jgi:hypothetical protein